MSSLGDRKLLWRPACNQTELWHEAHWRIQNLNDLLVELNQLDRYSARTQRQLFYRGQRDAEWEVISTFHRYAMSKFYPDEEAKPLSANAIRDFHFKSMGKFLSFHRETCDVNPDFAEDCKRKKLDHLFEIHCRIQQDPDRFDGRIKQAGSLILDWTVDPRIGLYFSIRGQDLQAPTSAAIYIYDPFALNFMSDSFTLFDELEEDLLNKQIRSDSVVICPPRQIEYLKKQVQKARYVSQQDLRHSLDGLWNQVLQEHETPNYQFHLKIEIPAEVICPLQKWLELQDFEERRLFPKERNS